MREVAVVKEQGRALTVAEFCNLADIPPEIEWFANLRNPNTRVAYENDLWDFDSTQPSGTVLALCLPV